MRNNKKSDIIEGISEVYLTDDGKKKNTGTYPNKIQRTFFNKTVAGNPVKLIPRGNNNGYIYITEGVENGLSLQEYINNEVWCSLSIVNIPTLPFENNKAYVIVFDNDFNKWNEINYSENLVQELDKFNVKYEINYADNTNNSNANNADNKTKIKYDHGKLNFLKYREKLSLLNDKHIFYLLPSEDGKDANDLLLEKIEITNADGTTQQTTKLKQLLSSPIIPISTQRTVRTNKGEIKQGWKPQVPPSLLDNNNNNSATAILDDDRSKTSSFLKLPYDSEGLALRFIARYGESYRFVKNVGVCKYKDGVYERDKDNDLFEDLRITLAKTYYEFDYLTDKDQINSFKKLWRTRDVGEPNTIFSVEKYAKRMVALEAAAEEFDNENNNVINLNNGIYDLDKQELLPHNPSELFFRKIEVDYSVEDNGRLGLHDNTDATAPSNDWIKFLNSSLGGDQTKIKYLQKAIGYTFSTSTKEEKVFFIKGVTRGGKNTFLETIQEVMGKYAEYETNDFITSREQNSNYLLDSRAQLKGVRMLHISELPANSKVNSTLIKNLVGDKNITGAEKFKGKIRYKSQVKYWIGTNNLDFDHFDDSVSRKLNIIEFNNGFYDEGTKEAIETGRVIDKTLKEKLLQPHNKEFILRWIIEGYRLYKEEGLKSTKEMDENLAQVKRDNDKILSFIDDDMKKYDESTQEIKGRKDISIVYQAYSNYDQKEYGTPLERIITLNKFFKTLRNRGFIIERKNDASGAKKSYIVGWALNWENVESKYEIEN
jgi:P4 family phage/plasmid primase-like protien